MALQPSEPCVYVLHLVFQLINSRIYCLNNGTYTSEAIVYFLFNLPHITLYVSNVAPYMGCLGGNELLEVSKRLLVR